MPKIFFAVAGKPILHSKSPLIFKSFAKKRNIIADYTRITGASVEKIVKLIFELNLTGINVTAPFKAQIIPFLHQQTKDSLAIGAVNTIKKRKIDYGVTILISWVYCIL